MEKITIEDFFKYLGFSIIFDVTCDNTEYKIPIEVRYVNKHSGYNDVYKFY